MLIHRHHCRALLALDNGLDLDLTCPVSGWAGERGGRAGEGVARVRLP